MQFNSKWLLGGQRCIFCLDLWDLWVYTSFVSFVPFFTEAYAHIVGSVVGMKMMTLNFTWSFKNRLPKTSKILPNLEEITKFPKEPSNWSDDVLVKLQVAFLFLRCKHSIEFASKWLQMLLSRLIRKPLQQKLKLKKRFALGWPTSMLQRISTKLSCNLQVLYRRHVDYAIYSNISSCAFFIHKYIYWRKVVFMPRSNWKKYCYRSMHYSHYTALQSFDRNCQQLHPFAPLILWYFTTPFGRALIQPML